MSPPDIFRQYHAKYIILNCLYYLPFCKLRSVADRLSGRFGESLTTRSLLFEP